MRIAIIVLLGVGVCAMSASAADPPINVKLTVAERAGFDRVDEPVTFGLPLPKDACNNAQKLCLLDDAGKPIPASFRDAQWWAPPGQPGPGRENARESIRWVHVSCLLSVPAKGTKTITLTNQPPAGVKPGDFADVKNASPEKVSPLQVTSDDKAGKATIVTGPVKLDLNANLPGVIESANFDAAGKFADGNKVINGSAGSGVTAGGKTFTEIEPGSAKVEVLENGPMRAVVLLKGKFKDSNTVGAVAEIPKMTDEPDKKVDMQKAEEGKNKGPGLVYEARVYAYAGSPRVFVDYTFINKLGVVPANKIDLQDLSIEWRLREPVAGMTIGDIKGPRYLATGNASSAVASAIDCKFGIQDSSTPGGGSGAEDVRPTKPVSLGWLTIGAAAVGIRDFWQTSPKALIAESDKAGPRITVGLFPRGASRSLELFIGQARTHRITLFLHDGKAKPEALNAVFAAANVPLMPVAEPAWYCQKTQAWGPITSADLDYGPFAETEKHYNKVLSDSMGNIVNNVEVGLTEVKKDKDGNVVKSVTQDGYGWMNWGDSFFRIGVEQPNAFKDPLKNLSWNGNYYDYGMAMVYQWARTGDWRYFDHGLRAGAYTADVFILHYSPEPTQIGACHYCPPRYHAAIDDGTPYYSEEFNHAKIHSTVMRWQLLGDWWARQVMFETFNHAEAMQNNFNAGWRQCRGNGHRLHILWSAYEFTGEQKYVDRAAMLLKLGVAMIKKETEFDKRPSQRFMVGVALEGMIQSYWIRPDKDVADTIKFVAEYANTEQKLKGYSACLAMAYGWLWEQTGDAAYLKPLVKLLDATGPTQHAKYFGQTFRSTPYALGYLHEAAAKGVKLPPRPPLTQPETQRGTDHLMQIQ